MIQFGILSVYFLTKYAKINSVYNLSCLTLLMDSLFPKFGVAFLTGAFASVMNPDTLNNPGFLVLSGFFSFIIFLLTKKLFIDIGGRTGAFAYIGNCLTFLIVYLGSHGGAYEYDPNIYLIDYDYYSSLNVYIFVFGPLISIIASLLVDLVALRWKDLVNITNRLLPYALVTCFGCMGLLLITTEYRKLSSGKIETYGEMFINFLNIGTISGITGRSRFLKGKSYFYYFYNYAGISLFSSFIGLGGLGIMRVGGKHGIVAFLGNALVMYIRDLLFRKINNDEDEKKIEKEIEAIKNKQIKNTEDIEKLAEFIDENKRKNNKEFINEKLNLLQRSFNYEIQKFDFCMK